jgi:hypothetical protein
MDFGLATAQAERIIAVGRTIEVVRVRITAAGRKALAKGHTEHAAHVEATASANR